MTPLHKKNDKRQIENYRPISNVSTFSKLYEKCLLFRLDEELPGIEGTNQHRFQKNHSTETALLMIQSGMASLLESGTPGIIYSMDLSAAFDLLRPDKFHDLFKNKLSEGLFFAIMDFLTNRWFQVELGDSVSALHHIDRGCMCSGLNTWAQTFQPIHA